MIIIKLGVVNTYNTNNVPYCPLAVTLDLCDFSVHKLGGKALSLATMHKLGLNVPCAVLFTTDLCDYYTQHNQTFPDDFDAYLIRAIDMLEQATGLKLGSTQNPLLVSVRSGAEISMPGIMETILNIGLTQQNAYLYPKHYKNFIIQYAAIVDDIHLFVAPDISVDDLLSEYALEVGRTFEQNPLVQLKQAIEAVLKSANSARTHRYRSIHNIHTPLPTAIIIQQMVFGDNNTDIQTISGAGVVVSRNPNNGMVGMVGEFIENASGSDLVSGKVTPIDIKIYQKKLGKNYTLLEETSHILERLYVSPIEIEFTIANNIVYFLQVRAIKISDMAAIETAISFLESGIIDEDGALLQIAPKLIERHLHPQIINSQSSVACASGIAASPGVATGHLVFTSEDAIQYAAEEKKVILMRYDTSPNDIHGMYAATGIITMRGGMTSHAAVSARGMGRPCVTGVTGIEIDMVAQKCIFKDIQLKKHDIISVDGTTGKIYAGTVLVHTATPSEAFLKLNLLSIKKSRMQVRVNADTPEELKIAEMFGFDGVGLCRTETSFLKGHSKLIVQKLIINRYLKRLQEIDVSGLMLEQITYFKNLFSHTPQKQVTVRLLDPPLQDIFPKSMTDMAYLAEKLEIDIHQLQQTVSDMTENNPTIGWRGCRLGILYPEIYKLQTEAILRAVVQNQSQGQHIQLEIMIPFVSFVSEFITIKSQIIDVYQKLCTQYPDLQMPKIGIMIELPRAALCAGAFALQADFLSFGTNDLTQTVLGISRDDAPHFMLDYLRRGLIPFDPFISMDLEGVGVLIRTAVVEARNSNPNIVIGLCGEHGADPNCVSFCENIGIDYLSCSPYRIAGARLASAQAVIMQSE